MSNLQQALSCLSERTISRRRAELAEIKNQRKVRIHLDLDLYGSDDDLLVGIIEIQFWIDENGQADPDITSIEFDDSSVGRFLENVFKGSSDSGRQVILDKIMALPCVRVQTEGFQARINEFKNRLMCSLSSSKAAHDEKTVNLILNEWF